MRNNVAVVAGNHFQQWGFTDGGTVGKPVKCCDALIDRYGSLEIIRLNHRKPEQKGRNRNLQQCFFIFLLLLGFCVPTCTSRLQFYKPIGFQVPNLIPSIFVRPTLSPEASEEWCTKSLTSCTLHRGKKDGMSACRGICAMISFSSGYCKIYAVAPFFIIGHVLEKTICKTCMLSCCGNIVCDICFRFSSVAVLTGWTNYDASLSLSAQLN